MNLTHQKKKPRRSYTLREGDGDMMATAMLMIVIIAAEASPIMGASRKRRFCDSNDNENDASVTTWR